MLVFLFSLLQNLGFSPTSYFHLLDGRKAEDINTEALLHNSQTLCLFSLKLLNKYSPLSP